MVSALGCGGNRTGLSRTGARACSTGGRGSTGDFLHPPHPRAPACAVQATLHCPHAAFGSPASALLGPCMIFCREHSSCLPASFLHCRPPCGAQSTGVLARRAGPSPTHPSQRSGEAEREERFGCKVCHRPGMGAQISRPQAQLPPLRDPLLQSQSTGPALPAVSPGP